MIKNYNYITTDHCRLHEFIISFFKRIEHENKPFDISFFEPDFQDIVNRHKTILKKQCKDIYEVISKWSKRKRSKFIRRIIISNSIENICHGTVKALSLDDIPSDIKPLIKDLFDNLYKQVLDGDPFNKKFNTTLRQHFDEFRTQNKELTLCPICGISELKTKYDTNRDQYDHYLPKSIYPLSSVNFKNLIPACTDCNSLEVKGDKDIVSIASNGKLFYIYDTSHKGIEVDFKISKDDEEIDNITWDINFLTPDVKIDEIESWKKIYNIEGRYKGFIKGRIESWYKAYLSYKQNSRLNSLSEQQKEDAYFVTLETDRELYLNFLRLPALQSFIRDSVLLKAEIDMKNYS
jgi:hypothetical protein